MADIRIHTKIPQLITITRGFEHKICLISKDNRRITNLNLQGNRLSYHIQTKIPRYDYVSSYTYIF